MSAIITEKFRKNNAKAFLRDLADEDNLYYVGLGKSDAWPASGGFVEDDSGYNVANPLGTPGDNSEILNNLTTLVGITAGTYTCVIPSILPKVNHRHKAYNPYDPTCFYQTLVEGIQMYPCYVVTNNNVYLCLREADEVETTYNMPSSSQSRIPQAYADGSVWLYIYSVQPSDPINVSQFVTVADNATLNGVETGGTVTAATGNLVYGFTVIDGGSGYVSPPVVSFISSAGVSTTLLASVSGGAIVSVTYPDGTVPNDWVKARGYVKVHTGNARVYPNVGPALGFGYHPAEDLPSWYTGIAVQVVEDVYGDGAYIPYRQVSIIRNPDSAGGTASPELSLRCLRRLHFGISGAPSSATTGALLTQASSGARAIVDYYDATNKYLYYHQTEETGFIAFTVSDVVSESSTYTVTALGASEYVKYTGEVVFVENRKKISRIGGQTEEVTIILQF